MFYSSLGVIWVPSLCTWVILLNFVYFLSWLIQLLLLLGYMLFILLNLLFTPKKKKMLFKKNDWSEIGPSPSITMMHITRNPPSPNHSARISSLWVWFEDESVFEHIMIFIFSEVMTKGQIIDAGYLKWIEVNYRIVKCSVKNPVMGNEMGQKFVQRYCKFHIWREGI